MTDLESIFKYTESGRYKEGGITFVVNNLEDIMIFTLYGSKVDDTIGESIGFRAINQKELADYTTETVFNILFNNEVYVRYNVHVPLDEDELNSRLERLLLKLNWRKSARIKEYRKNKDNIIKAEIDGQIFFQGVESIGDWVEAKLYTCPGNEGLNVLKKHMDNGSLQNYFRINKYLALIGFSYIRERTSDGLDIPSDNPTDSPLPYDQDKHYPYGLGSVWAINISFMNSNILTVKTKPSERAMLIFNGINRNLNDLSDELDLESKGLFFKNTVNLVKVHQMGQIIESYKRRNDELSNSLRDSEEEIKRLKKENKKLKAVEKENKKLKAVEEKYEKLKAVEEKYEKLKAFEEKYERLKAVEEEIKRLKKENEMLKRKKEP